MNFREFINKLQNLPDNKKKIILWAVVGVLAIIMAVFWINGAINNFSKIGNSVSQIKLPEIQPPATDILQTVSPTDQTADWKTYTNTDYGFEIKYPKDWYLKKVGQGIVTGGVYISPYKPDETETGGMEFTNEALNIAFAAAKSSLLEFIEDYLNLSIAVKFEMENIKIDGASGLKIKVACDGIGCGNPIWFIMKDKKVYIFNSGLSDKIDIFDQMISTFKFTK